MRFGNNNKHLVFYKDYQASQSIVLKIVDGNPLAVRESCDRSTSHLSLVRKQEGILTRKKPVVVPPVQPLSWYGRGWRWLQDNGPGIQSVAIIGGVVMWVALIYFRLEKLEEKITGTGGLVDMGKELGKMGERLAHIEGQFQSFEKYMLPQIFKPKALELGFTDPRIVPVKLVGSCH